MRTTVVWQFMAATIAARRFRHRADAFTRSSTARRKCTAGHRPTVSVAILLILGATLPLRAEEEIRILSEVRAEIEAHRQRHSLLRVELNDGTLLTGSVGAVRKNEFAIITGLHTRLPVGYGKVQAFVDPETGQTVALVRQAPWPTGRVISPRAKLIAVIVAAAVATVYIVALVIVTHAK